MTTAKIAALSKCEDTGITPLLAHQLWPRLGHGVVAVVELLVDEHSEDSEGAKGIKLVINSIEPATDPLTENHLRELQRALYMTRNPQPKLGDPDEETVKDIVRRGDALTAADHEAIIDWIADHAEELASKMPGVESITVHKAPRPGSSATTPPPTSTADLQDHTQPVHTASDDVDTLTEQGTKTLDLLAGGDEEPDGVGQTSQDAITTDGDPS